MRKWSRFMVVVGVVCLCVVWCSRRSTAVAAPDPMPGSNVGVPGPGSGSDAASPTAAAGSDTGEAAREAEKQDAKKAAADAAELAKDLARQGAAIREALVTFDATLNKFAGLRVHLEGKKETSTGADQANGSVSGLSGQNIPDWSLVADAAVTSLDFSQPTVSLGLEHTTPMSLQMVAVKKNTANNSVSAAGRDPAFGRAVLAPALANFSIAAHLEFRPWAYIQCDIDCRLPDRKINTKKSKGLYASGEASFSELVDTTAMRADGSAVSGLFVPLAVSAGFVYRLEGAMPDGAKLGTTKLGLAGYLGLAARVIAGDIDHADRATIFGTSKRFYGGFELGATVQIGNVLIDPRLIVLTNDRDRIPGLTGAQIQINLSFILPWTVVGGK